MVLSDISIKRPVFAWMLMLSLLVFGGLSYSKMGISQLPDVDFPFVTISVAWAGASPDVMESAVADVIESAVMSVDGIQLVQSNSQQSMTNITIQFNLDQDINVALQQVQTKVSQAQRNLPQTIDPPVITKSNPSDQPILWAAAYSKESNIRDLALFVRNHLKDTLTTILGVGDVTMGGYVEPQMRIWMYNDKMRAKDITYQDIVDAINGEHQLSPTGYQSTGAKESYVRVHSEFSNSKECEDLVIPSRKGIPSYRPVRLGEVAKCVEATDEIRRISRYNQIQPTIGLGIIKQRGTNAVAIGDAVRKKIEALNKTLPQGINMGIVTDTTTFIKQSVNELVMNLAMSILLTAIVCYLFLGNLSSAFNVIIAIPVSLIGSFIVLRALNFTVNSFTLLGLSLSIGIVVDDAIMVLENITRHAEMGKQRMHAALVGAREITGAATAATLAILAIFIPVVFMQGIVGKFFFQFGVTISVAVLISLLEALTLAPMRCSQYLRLRADNRVTQAVSRYMDYLAVQYRRSLKWCLQRRKRILGASLAIFFLSLFIVKFLQKELVPSQDQSRFLVTLYTPMGSSLSFTDDVFKEAEKVFASRPEIEKFYIAVGGFGGGLVNQGISFITMKEIGHRPVAEPFTKAPTQLEMMAYLRKALEKIKGVQRVAIMDLSQAGFSGQRGFPIEFQVQGPDWEKLAQVSLDIRKHLKESGFMAEVDSDYNPNMPEIEIFPDREKASKRGVLVSTISQAVAAMVGGIKLLPNKYTDAFGHRSDIQIKLVADQNQDEASINKIQVRNVTGWSVPLSELVDIKPGNTLLTITRYNRERGIGVFGNPAKGKSQGEVIEYVQKATKQFLPSGYHITLSGNSQALAESNKSLMIALILGIFVAYMVLGTQFNSFIQPVVILLALPFSITGALLGMWITNTSLNIYSTIGILLLMGIVKKNSILLVEFTNHKRAEGLNIFDALIEACPIRLRPILMTSIATIAGALPQAFASGEGSEIVRPMAITIIFGVAASTFLTLFVVPCGYMILSRFEDKKHAVELAASLAAIEKATPSH